MTFKDLSSKTGTPPKPLPSKSVEPNAGDKAPPSLRP